MKIKVLKFGGSSIKDAASMRRALDIVRSEKDSNLLVALSACGGVTNELIKLAPLAAAGSGAECRRRIDALENKHISICKELIGGVAARREIIDGVKALCGELSVFLEGVGLLSEATPRARDYTLSFGERLSTLLFEGACRSAGLDSILTDARKLIATNSAFGEAAVDAVKTKAILKREIDFSPGTYRIAVTQGFIGSDGQGRTTTLGRGGSDYSAALMGAMLGAEEIQIWTDVDGIMSADPGIIDDAFTIPETSFSEVMELSYYGLKALHPQALKPAVENSVPVRIMNTFNPAGGNTLIVEKINGCVPRFSLVLREDCAIFSLKTSGGDNVSGLSKAIIAAVAAAGGKVLNYFGTENYFSLIYDGSLGDVRDSLLDTFQEHDLAIVPISLLCICGSGVGNAGAMGRIYSSLSGAGPFGMFAVNYSLSATLCFPPADGLSALKLAHKQILRETGRARI